MWEGEARTKKHYPLQAFPFRIIKWSAQNFHPLQILLWEPVIFLATGTQKISKLAGIASVLLLLLKNTA